jgi:nitrate reductase NapE
MIQIKAARDSLSYPCTKVRPGSRPSPTIGSECEMSVTGDDTTGRPRRRRMEVFAFLFLTVVLMPVLAVATVGGYGLAVWVYQIVAGPPGPPVR